MKIADTDVLIDALRGFEPSTSMVRSAIAGRTLATTAVSAFEILSGARTRAELDLIGDLLAPLPILVFDDRAAEAAATSRRELERRGQTIGMADYLIAGICLSRSATLLTRNRRHFERIPNLLLGDLPVQ
jgi:predicted nucleic acid-binding protein